jgi:hypothetical protein
MELLKGKYFLYTHFRQDKNEVFYVGIGTKPKKFKSFEAEYRRAYSKKNRNKHWHNIINLNPNYEIKIVIESDNYNWIKQQEILLIFIYGRVDLNLGTLCNWTNGGDGTINLNEEIRKIMSFKRTGKKHTKEAKKKISIANTGNSYRKGDKNSESHKLKQSIYMKNSYKNGERKNPNPKGVKRDSVLMNNINSKKRKVILQLSLEGDFIQEWESVKSANLYFNLSNSAISNCLRGDCKTSQGFKWVYKT